MTSSTRAATREASGDGARNGATSPPPAVVVTPSRSADPAVGCSAAPAVGSTATVLRSPSSASLDGRSTSALPAGGRAAGSGGHVDVHYPRVRGGELHLVEGISESGFTWSVPHAWLQLSRAEQHARVAVVQAELSDELWKVESGGSPSRGRRGALAEEDPSSWGDVSVLDRLKYDLSRERRSSQAQWVRFRLSRERQRLVEVAEAEAAYRKLLGRAKADAARGGGRGASFKPSTSKKDHSLRYVSTNLHSQRLLVFPPSPAPGASVEWTDGAAPLPICTAIASYSFVTGGAPSAHSLGFEAGGLHQIRSRIQRCLDEVEET